MESTGVERRLTAIMAADVVGYSRLMGADPEATLENLTACRELFTECIAHHHGRVVDAPGDSILAEFASVVDAVECAVELQRQLAERNETQASDRRMEFRIGVNLGDVLVKEGALYGDGVNVAARLEGLAAPGGICISRPVYDQIRSRLPLEFEYLGEQQTKNIADPVRAYSVRIHEEAPSPPEASSASPAEAPAQPAPHESPSIAVLPFDNIGGDPEQEYFSDGITEEIITQLTRFRELKIIARNSTFRFKGQAVDVREVGRELGARYVVEGSLRRAGERIRITAQLLDAHDGTHLWAETYDRKLSADNIFDIQDEITSRIVGTIADSYGIVSRTGLEESRRKPPSSLDAYDWVLQAYAYYREFSPERHLVIRDGLEQAMGREPDYADGWAWLAAMYRDEHIQGYNPRPNSLERAETAARKALALDPINRQAHLVMAHVHYYRGDVGAFDQQAEKLLTLHPHSADANAVMGTCFAFSGRFDRGVALARRAMELNPDHPGWFYSPLILDQYMREDYGQALDYARKMHMPHLLSSHAYLAATLGQLGRIEEAGKSVKRMLELKPLDSVISRLRRTFVHRPLLEALFDGLRKAGMDIPEE